MDARSKTAALRTRAAATLAAARGRQPAPAGGPGAHAADDPVAFAARRDLTDFESMRRLLAFSLGPADSCVDIGAHRGSVLSEMLRVAPQGRHIAFEPIPELAELLRRDFPGVEVHQAALSNAPGESQFAHVRGTAEGWSGLKFRPLPGGEQAEVEQLTVKLEVLDDILAPEFRPVVIKIDVEGAELQVLQGALTTLKTHRPTVVFEHGSGSAEVFGTTPRDVFELFRDEVGFRLFDLDGNGPFELEEFEHNFSSGKLVNWVAKP